MTWHFENHGDGHSNENVDVNGVMTWQFSSSNGGATTAMTVNDEMTAVNGKFLPEDDEVKGKLTWMLNNNGGVTTAVNGDFSPENVEGNDEMKGVMTWQATAVNDEAKNMLTWQINNNGGLTTVNGPVNVNDGTEGMLTCQMNNNGGLTTVNDDTKGMLTWQFNGEAVTGEMKSMLTCQTNNGGLTTVNRDGYSPVNGNDDTEGMLTWQLNGEVVTDEMLTWQNNNEEDENELSKFLEEASSWSEMMTWQNSKVKIINGYPYWLPLMFQTGAAYVTINGNEELCGSSFSDSDTSYMAGISGCCGFVGGACGGVADEARGWGECEDEMLASFLGEGVGE